VVGRDADFAIAHLGWGNLEAELGRLEKAEFHATKAYRAALRVGRHGLAASAYHDLMTVKIHTDDLTAAWKYAREAVAVYKVDHPRFPALSHDIAFLWGKLGMYSSALPIFLAVLPAMTRRKERLVVLANVARAAAASHERLFYERAKREILGAITENYDVPATACYHLACACKTYEDWTHAEALAQRARARAGGRWLALADELIAAIAARESGDDDVLPPDGGEIDRIREILLRRLKKHGATFGTEEVPPERYPIT
jgi:tetratricopeptide (TPR) repeat protein